MQCTIQNIIGVCYKTAWNMWKPGELDAYQLPSGTILVKDNQDLRKDTNCSVNIRNNYQKYTTYRSNR